MRFSFNHHEIPVTSGQAVSRGWTAETGHRPAGVTWHWTATWDLEVCRRLLGGSDPARKGAASAHYGIGRSFREGVDRYVSIGNRSWHAGVGQSLRWDGRPSNSRTRGARTCIGIETVNIGYARRGVVAERDWLLAGSVNGRHHLRIQPWTDEQIEMMIAVGREIQAHWPHLRPEDHHGHADLCPGRKEDVTGFPFATVLRGIYGADAVEDVWTPFLLPEQRQQALIDLGYDPGPAGADGSWGRLSDAAMRAFQRDAGLIEDGYWTVFVGRAAAHALKAPGGTPALVTASV